MTGDVMGRTFYLVDGNSFDLRMRSAHVDFQKNLNCNWQVLRQLFMAFGTNANHSRSSIKQKCTWEKSCNFCTISNLSADEKRHQFSCRPSSDKVRLFCATLSDRWPGMACICSKWKEEKQFRREMSSERSAVWSGEWPPRVSSQLTAAGVDSLFIELDTCSQKRSQSFRCLKTHDEWKLVVWHFN